MKMQFWATLSSRLFVNTTFAVAGLAVLVTSAQATSLVANGDFEQLLRPGVSAEFGSRYSSQQVIGWTTSGYNFVYTPGTADTAPGAKGEYGGVQLWGPHNGSSNGLPATSPTGGNFLAMDGAYAVGPVSQTISGLAPGQSTTVSFYWGAAQQSGYNGATRERFEVSLGSQNQFTPIISNPSHGFSGWRQETFTFTPTSASEVLSFLSIGTPGGVPPFALLDGVSVSDTPEPATWALLGASLAGFSGFRLLRRRSARTAKG